MPGGINIPGGTIASLGAIVAGRAVGAALRPGDATVQPSGPYRPPQWSKAALTMITVPAAYAGAENAGQVLGLQEGVQTIQGRGATLSAPQIYVFDGVERTGHSQPVTMTSNPVQTGSNIADHAFLQPARVTMGIAMSDAMDAYGPGMWTGGPTKSISAFRKLDELRAARIPLTVTTRLKTYTNMLILDVRVDDTLKTLYGLAATVEFGQIYVANVATQALSARGQTTDATNQGTVQPSVPTPGVIAQHQLPSASTGAGNAEAIQADTGTVPGAGTWSSNNTGSIAQRFPMSTAP